VTDDSDQVRFNLFDAGRDYFGFDGTPINWNDFTKEWEEAYKTAESRYEQREHWNGANGKYSRPHITNCFNPGDSGYDLPRSYIDGGIILTKGITITRREFDDFSRLEWEELGQLVEKFPNLIVEELVKTKVLWIYDRPPTITTMANG
jgi:hypothetical protein